MIHECPPQSPREQSIHPSEPNWYAAYTLPGQEWRAREELQDAGLEERFLPALVHLDEWMRRGAEGKPPLLFTRYVFFRTAEDPELLPDRVARTQSVLYVAGASPRRPSPVLNHEMAVLRELCSQDRHPELGPMPETGRVARIVQGPLAGAEGVVRRCTKTQIRLAFTMPILAGCYELAVPPEFVVSVGFLGTKKPRHRGGRRGRSRGAAGAAA